MDYNSSNSEPWEWQDEDYCIQKDANLGLPEDEDLSCIFGETTPVKACGDLAYHVGYSGNMNKETDACWEISSQVKRRRMLQFHSQAMDPPAFGEELSFEFLRSNERVDSVEEDFAEASQWESGGSGFVDTMSTSCYETLNPYPDEWLSECINEAGMHFSPDDLNLSGESDIQMDISEFSHIAPQHEATVIQRRVTRTQTPGKIVFKGKKSYVQTPPKLPSSVAYPFTFIKPCGGHGDVTLKDINQRIRTPPPSKSKENVEDPAESYPTSAFSGKPVVVKTKIHTEGGKGSITIMRTKG